MEDWPELPSKIIHDPASITSEDFSDCYNRTAHPPLSIALHDFGTPRSAVKVMLKLLQIMQFCLRTGFGESKQTYGGSEDNPLVGSGQGNGGAPPAFTALSTLVVNAYKRLGHGATLSLCASWPGFISWPWFCMWMMVTGYKRRTSQLTLMRT